MLPPNAGIGTGFPSWSSEHPSGVRNSTLNPNFPSVGAFPLRQLSPSPPSTVLRPDPPPSGTL